MAILVIYILAIMSSWYGSVALAGCPFASLLGTKSFETEEDIVELLQERFNHTLYSKGQDLETRLRGDPTKKNLFGPCPSETCRPDYSYRTMSGFCNNLQSNVAFGRRATRLKRLLSPGYTDFQERTKSVDQVSVLPSARLVSSVVHSGGSSNPAKYRLICFSP